MWLKADNGGFVSIDNGYRKVLPNINSVRAFKDENGKTMAIVSYSKQPVYKYREYKYKEIVRK
jgi:hypothetical protein